MVSKRKFHRTTIKVVVLSEEPFVCGELKDVHEAITGGDCSGSVDVESAEVLDGKQMADALCEQASAPEFFRLDENGNDEEDD